MKLLITGSPGSGKTTLCIKLANELKARGRKLAGFVTREIREKGIRKGFELIDIETGRKSILAHVDFKSDRRIGKYHVNLAAIDEFSEIIERGMENAELLIIDEIGPMELLSRKFIKAVRKAFEKSENIIASIHYKSQHELIKEIKAREDVILFEISKENREKALKEILSILNP